jgi:hypothetical protein
MVPGSIPGGVTGFFSDIFLPTYHGPGVDSDPSENEYQEYFLGVKAAGSWGWQPHHFHVSIIVEIWEPKPPGTLWATPGLLRDCFNFDFFTKFYSDNHINHIKEDDLRAFVDFTLTETCYIYVYQRCTRTELLRIQVFGMWRFLVGGAVQDVSKAPWFLLLGLFIPEMSLRCSETSTSPHPKTLSHHRGHEFSATPPQEPQILQIYVAADEVTKRFYRGIRMEEMIRF